MTIRDGQWAESIRAAKPRAHGNNAATDLLADVKARVDENLTEVVVASTLSLQLQSEMEILVRVAAASFQAGTWSVSAQRLARTEPKLLEIFKPSARVVMVHLPGLCKWGGYNPWEANSLFDVRTTAPVVSCTTAPGV